jgi:hypothetical protein
MHRLDRSPRIPVFVAPDSRAAWVETVVIVEPGASMRPGDLEWLVEKVAHRIEDALEGAFDGLPGGAILDIVGVANPQSVPFYPVALGGERYECAAEIIEVIENLRAGTPLDELAYDSGGRAFACDVQIIFRRVPREDQEVSSVWTLDDGRIVASDTVEGAGE